MYNLIKKFYSFFPTRSSLGRAGRNSKLQYPCYVTTPKSIYMEDNTVIRRGSCIINNKNEKVFIKQYTVISVNCTIVTNNHKSIVGVPQCLLGSSHINDISKDLVIGEDVFIGADVIILPFGDIGRGCIVGAGSVVTKPIPPYAVVAGNPAHIIGVKFSIDQILQHEKILYPDEDRMKRSDIESLFKTYYQGLKVLGTEKKLSEEDIVKLNEAKKFRKFIEPTHNEIKFR